MFLTKPGENAENLSNRSDKSNTEDKAYFNNPNQLPSQVHTMTIPENSYNSEEEDNDSKSMDFNNENSSSRENEVGADPFGSSGSEDGLDNQKNNSNKKFNDRHNDDMWEQEELFNFSFDEENEGDSMQDPPVKEGTIFSSSSKDADGYQISSQKRGNLIRNDSNNESIENPHNMTENIIVHSDLKDQKSNRKESYTLSNEFKNNKKVPFPPPKLRTGASTEELRDIESEFDENDKDSNTNPNHNQESYSIPEKNSPMPLSVKQTTLRNNFKISINNTDLPPMQEYFTNTKTNSEVTIDENYLNYPETTTAEPPKRDPLFKLNLGGKNAGKGISPLKGLYDLTLFDVDVANTFLFATSKFNHNKSVTIGGAYKINIGLKENFSLQVTNKKYSLNPIFEKMFEEGRQGSSEDHIIFSPLPEKLILEERTKLIFAEDQKQGFFYIQKISNLEVQNIFPLRSMQEGLVKISNIYKYGKQKMLTNRHLLDLIFYLENIIAYLHDFKYAPDRDYANFDIDTPPDVNRQKLMKDFNFIDILIDLIHYPFKNNFYQQEDAHKVLYVTQMLSLSYTSIRFGIMNYRTNELYASQWLEMIIDYGMKEI